MSRSPRLGFFLFIVLNATLFIRPQELIPALGEPPIYNIVILTCLAVSAFAVLGQLSPRSLSHNAINACVLCLFGSAIVSHLAHFQIREAIDSGVELIKVVLYYFLLVSLLDSFSRIRSFLLWLCFFVVVLTSLGLLHYYEIVSIPALEAYHERQWELEDEDTDQPIVLARLQCTGIYNNPNDLSRILTVGILISLYFMGDGRFGMFRALWLLPILLFGHGLQLTQSRGGLLSLLGGLVAFFYGRFGAKKSLLATALVLPILFVAFAGRQTKMSTSEGTGQERIKIWNEGFIALQSSPVFGIGMNQYAEEVHIVAHNSFVHCYVELGIIGGIFFFALSYLPVRALQSRIPTGPPGLASELIRLRPLVFALLIATVVGMLSSTRSYSLPTYLIVGLGAAYLRILADQGCPLLPLFDGRLLGRLAFLSTLTLIGFYIYVRLAARY